MATLPARLFDLSRKERQVKDWIVNDVGVDPGYPLMFRVAGINLAAANPLDRDFYWLVLLIGQMHRYDVRNATISPEAAELAKRLYMRATGRA